jgi:AcrR family transcriptional regulator
MPPVRPWRGIAAEDRLTERRERLVAAALELLGREDADALTVRGVCAQAGLTPRYFYESFPDADALVVAAFDHVVAGTAAAILDALADAPGDVTGRARAAIAGGIAHLTDDARRGRILLADATANATLQRRRREALHGFARLVSDQAADYFGDAAPPEHDRFLTALALVAGLAELLVAHLQGILDVTRDELVDHAARLFSAAASGPGPASAPSLTPAAAAGARRRAPRRR